MQKEVSAQQISAPSDDLKAFERILEVLRTVRRLCLQNETVVEIASTQVRKGLVHLCHLQISRFMLTLA